MCFLLDSFLLALSQLCEIFASVIVGALDITSALLRVKDRSVLGFFKEANLFFVSSELQNSQQTQYPKAVGAPKIKQGLGKKWKSWRTEMLRSEWNLGSLKTTPAEVTETLPLALQLKQRLSCYAVIASFYFHFQAEICVVPLKQPLHPPATDVISSCINAFSYITARCLFWRCKISPYATSSFLLGFLRPWR